MAIFLVDQVFIKESALHSFFPMVMLFLTNTIVYNIVFILKTFFTNLLPEKFT